MILVHPLRVQLSLLLSLLLLAYLRKQADVLLAELLLRLAKAELLLPEARDPLTEARLLLLTGESRLNALQPELRTLQSEVASRFRALHAQLRALQTARLSHLLGAQTKATACFGRARRRASANLPKLPAELRRLLRTVGRAFKARRPHLRRRAALLFENVAVQLLLGHRLPRSAKGPSSNGLRPKLLVLQFALPSDV